MIPETLHPARGKELLTIRECLFPMGLTVGCWELEAILDCLLATVEGGATKPVLPTLGKQLTVLLLRGLSSSDTC